MFNRYMFLIALSTLLSFTVPHLDAKGYIELQKSKGQLHLDQILKNNEYVVLDFSTTWCGPCKSLKANLYKITNKLPDVQFVVVDGDQHRNLAEKYGVMAYPTLILIKNGEQLPGKEGRISGFTSVDNITRNISENFGLTTTTGTTEVSSRKVKKARKCPSCPTK